MKYNILCVDDEETSTRVINRLLRSEYQVFVAQNADEAFNIFNQHTIALVLTDQRMPVTTGLEFLAKIAAINKDTIRLLFTAYTDASLLVDAINSGLVYRYIKKPFDPDQLKETVASAIESYRISMNNKSLIQELQDLFEGTVKAITDALDAKDSYTFGRSKRVTELAIETAKNLDLTEEELQDLELAGLLHDIGMIGVPERIMHKVEDLTEDEISLIRTHPVKSVKILDNIKQLDHVSKVIRHHHERFDGRGYPDGLEGENIPLPSRIIAVADAYDGMTSERAYRKGIPHIIAVKEIKKLAGKQFDPQVVEVFINMINNKHLAK